MWQQIQHYFPNVAYISSINKITRSNIKINCSVTQYLNIKLIIDFCNGSPIELTVTSDMALLYNNQFLWAIFCNGSPIRLTVTSDMALLYNNQFLWAISIELTMTSDMALLYNNQFLWAILSR